MVFYALRKLTFRYRKNDSVQSLKPKRWEVNGLNLSSSFCFNIKAKGAAMKIKRNVDNEEHYQERCYIVIDTNIMGYEDIDDDRSNIHKWSRCEI